jgi:hypothetical protein
MNKTFYAEDDFFEAFVAICYASNVPYSGILNQMIRDFIKTHYRVLFNKPGVNEIIGEIDPDVDLEKFVKKVAKLSIKKVKKPPKPKVAKQVKERKQYVRQAAVTNVCEPEDVKDEVY